MNKNQYDFSKIKEMYENKYYHTDKNGNAKKKYLTTNQISKKLGYNSNTFQKWINRNVIIEDSRKIIFKKNIKN